MVSQSQSVFLSRDRSKRVWDRSKRMWTLSQSELGPIWGRSKTKQDFLSKENFPEWNWDSKVCLRKRATLSAKETSWVFGNRYWRIKRAEYSLTNIENLPLIWRNRFNLYKIHVPYCCCGNRRIYVPLKSWAIRVSSHWQDSLIKFVEQLPAFVATTCIIRFFFSWSKFKLIVKQELVQRTFKSGFWTSFQLLHIRLVLLSFDP